MLSLRTHVTIMAGLFAAILGLAMIGNALEESGTVLATPAVRLTAIITFGVLTALLAFSAVPVMVKLVLVLQAPANLGSPVVDILLRRERAIIFACWALMALGLAIAVPAAIVDGAFD